MCGRKSYVKVLLRKSSCYCCSFLHNFSLEQSVNLFSVAVWDVAPLLLLCSSISSGDNSLAGRVACAQESRSVVTCLDETRHSFQDGDYVTFSEVQGMTELNRCEPRPVNVLGELSRVDVGWRMDECWHTRVLLSWFHVRLKINIIVMVSNAVTTCLLFWMVSCWVLKNRRSSPPYLLCGLRLTSYLSKIPFGKDLKPLRERLEISMVVALLICAFMNKLGKLVHSFFRWGSLEENDYRHWCNNMCVENGRYGHTPIRSDTSVRVYTTADTDTSTPCVGVPATCNIRPGRSLRQRSS